MAGQDPGGPGGGEDGAVVAAARAGDESAFAGLAERYRPELQAHCYRMLGSLEDSEDLVQETFLRAWRRRESFQGRSTFRAWLYRIATNACLDFLDRRPRGRRVARPAERHAGAPQPVEVPWLGPYPDALLEPAAPGEAEPPAVVVAKETIELAFLVAVQTLPPRQRAVLILRDVLGWPAKDTAAALESSVAAVNSALQRARPVLRARLPRRRGEWAPAADPTAAERALVDRYVAAIERADDDALAALLRADARVGHQPGAGGHTGSEPVWYAGRETIVAAWSPALHGPDAVDFKFVLTHANRQPALASYIRRRFPRDTDAERRREAGGSEFRAFALTVLRVEDGLVAEVTNFHPGVFPAFGLPPTM